MGYTPQRKSVSVNTNGAKVRASAGSDGGAKYSRKAATSAQASKATYTRKSAGVSPSGVSVNDKDRSK